MRVKSIELKQVDFELTRPYTIAFRTITHVSNIVVKLVSDTGLVGLGAGSPEKFVTGESIEQGLDALNSNLETLLHRQEINHEFLNTLYQKFRSSPAAGAAVDMALWDLLARSTRQSICELIGKKRDRLPTSITIGIKPVNEVVKEGQEYISRGFQIIKLKLGKDFEEDIERTIKLREAVGPEIKIRVDLNQGYDTKQTAEYFDLTKDSGIEFCEQPIEKSGFQKILQLPQDIRSRIAVDESLQTPEDAQSFTAPHPWCGIFNIKLMKTGGITPALEIAKTAEQSGIDLMWGCMDESKISIAAALHVAFACSATKYIDLDGHLDLNHDIVDADFKIENGVMILGRQPGLGCELLPHQKVF